MHLLLPMSVTPLSKPACIRPRYHQQCPRVSFLPALSAREPLIQVRSRATLRAEDFERFVAFFQAQNRDIRATDDRGRTLLDIVRGHGKSEPFVAILEKAGG